MQKQLSVSEIKAVAEAAITARHVADGAKAALDADPENDTLKTAHVEAERKATEAKTKADALSQDTSQLTPEQIAKKKRKLAYISKELRDAGELDDNDDDADVDDDMDDPDRPLTVGDYQRMEAKKANDTAAQMADAIEDPVAKEAVKAALKGVVPTGKPEEDFKRAVAIANIDKNNKVLEEIARRPVPRQHSSGAGGPARQEGGTFEPTAEEAKYMRAFKLTEKDILKARADAQAQSAS